MANTSKKNLTHQQKIQLRLYKPVMNYRNGHKKQRIKNNILTRYYNNGRIKSIQAFDEEKWDVCDGPFEQRYKNSSLRVKGEILVKGWEEIKIGQWIEYYGPEYKKGSGVIKCMGEFELFNNYYHSDHDRHFPSWTVYQENCTGFYGSKKKGSLKNGVWKYFSPDGVLASEMIWKKGIKWEGTITSFHPNGRQWKEEIFETKKKRLLLTRGGQPKLVTEWDENGNLIKKVKVLDIRQEFKLEENYGKEIKLANSLDPELLII